MVCKDEVWLWFKDKEPHRRLELVCGLLNMCLPLELRFITTCVEDLNKRDFHDLRDAEYKANNTQEIKRLSNLLDERTRSNLIVYIALLSSRNHTCSTLLYQTLVEAQQEPPTTDVNHIKEMLLVYTMVLHHPAFTFEQKRVIAELYERATRLEAQLTQHQDLDTHLLEAFPGCTAAPEVGVWVVVGVALRERAVSPVCVSGLTVPCWWVGRWALWQDRTYFSGDRKGGEGGKGQGFGLVCHPGEGRTQGSVLHNCTCMGTRYSSMVCYNHTPSHCTCTYILKSGE